MEKITVIGGGLAGSLVAIYFAKKGFDVALFERRPDMRRTDIAAGRSINLALSNRGLRALEKVGLDKEILKEAIPMRGRMMHSVEGELAFQPYGKAGEAIYSVSRGNLNIQLLKLADEHENITIHFEHKCTHVDYDNNKATFINAEGKEVTVDTGRVIGSDGAYAATRGVLEKTDRFDYSQAYLKHGYKELTIPATADGNFAMDANSLHIWPRGQYMMIALPNPDKSFTCTLFFPFEGAKSFETIDTTEKLQSFFKEQFNDAVGMMPTLNQDYFENPTGSLVTVRCYPWVKGDKLALLGDAAHAVVPFYGQGMNCAFEDCVILDECMDKYLPDWSKVFDEYQKERKPNADAIADLALQNFVEMRDLVGDEAFLHKKHVEHELSEKYPQDFISQYELTTFTHKPYSYALQQGAKNDNLLAEIINNGWEDKIDDQAFMQQLFTKHLS